MAIYTLSDFDQVWEFKVRWHAARFDYGESRFMFREPVVSGDRQLNAYSLWLDGPHDLWRARRPANWTFTDIVVSDYWPGLQADRVFPINQGHLGGGGAYAPSQLTPVAKWRSDEYGRSYRGRTYWGPIQIQDIGVNDGPQDELISAVGAWQFSMYEVFGPDAPFVDPQFVILSEYHNGALREIPVFVRMLEFGMNPAFGVQRRRVKEWTH